MSTVIFYYWLENVSTKEEKRVPSFSWLGDVNEVIGGKWVIKDWSIEEEVM